VQSRGRTAVPAAPSNAQPGATAPEPWLHGLLRQCRTVAGADAAAVLFADPAGGLHVADVVGLAAGAQLSTFDFGQTASDLRQAWRDARPTFTARVDETRAARLGVGEVRSYLAVPLEDERESQGVLAVAWREEAPALSADRLAILEIIARHIASQRRHAAIVERLRASESESERARRLYAVLSECNQAIVRAESVGQLLGDVCAAVVGAGGVALAWVGWLDETTGVLRPEVWRGEPAAFARRLRIPLEPASPPDRAVASRALREGRIQVVDDVTAGPPHGPNQTRARHAGFRSFAVAPLEHGGRRGLIGLHATEVGFFRAEDGRLLGELAADVAYGLDHLHARSERQRGEAALRAVFETVRDGLVLMDDAGRIELANAAAARMFGLEVHELVGRSADALWADPVEVARPVGRRRRSVRAAQRVGRRADGSVFPLEVATGGVSTPYGRRQAGVLRDTSAQRRAATALEWAASHEPGTGLWNRTGLWRHLEALAEQASRPSGGRVALAVLDLDEFQRTNDLLGTDTADQVLAAFGRRLARAAGGQGVAARIGGDEFALAVPLDDDRDAGTWAEDLMRALGRPLRAGRRSVRAPASVGVAVLPDHGSRLESLSARAGLALRLAKAEGGNTARLFAPEMEREQEALRAAPDRMTRAIEHGELELYFQPQVNMETREVRALEALLRWRDGERGLLAPGEFLYLVRDRETMARLGEWVTATALSHWRTWHDAGLDLRVAVNVAPQHFLADGFADGLRRRLQQVGALGRDVFEVEITESAAIADTRRAREVMQDLRAMGVRLSLDDFGTGYASIAYLSDLPFDTIKVDLTFTRDMLETPGGWAIAHAILLMGISADREVVAEGVETAALEEALLRMGTRIGQGYLYGRPMPASEIPAWVRRWRVEGQPAAGRSGGGPLTDHADYMTAIQLHLRWIGRVFTALRHPPDPLAAEDVGENVQCAFGSWYQRYPHPGRSLGSLLELHRDSHRLAHAVAELATDASARRAELERALTANTEAFLVEAYRVFFAAGEEAPALRTALQGS